MTDVLEICDSYIDMQVWSVEPAIQANLWLQNFTEEEKPYAEHLLASFLVFNEKMSRALLKAAYQKCYRDAIERGIVKNKEEFLKETIFSTVDIEDINMTSSGYNVCRMARHCLDIPEEQFLPKREALNKLTSKTAKIIILLDDFIGSGVQFTNSWTETENVNGRDVSYASICASEDITAYYIPLLATTYGLDGIYTICNNINIIPGNLLDETYSALSEKSFIWPDELKAGSEGFLFSASKRAGIVNWKGYNDLALTISISNSMPDATLPLFYWNKNGWKPLMNRP